MKQHITIKQWEELNPTDGAKLIRWIHSKEWDSLLAFASKERRGFRLSIGQMIEFLIENEQGERKLHYTQIPIRRTENDKKLEWTWTNQWQSTRFSSSYKELCDALWEAMKKTLNEA